MRDKPPCAPYAALRDQLRALAARQREGGWEALVVFTGTPDWAARPASGCRRDAGAGASPAPTRCPPTARSSAACSTSRPPRARALRLPDALERAQPPVLPLAPARELRPRLAVAAPSSPTAGSPRPCGPSCGAGRPASSCSARRPGILEPSARATAVRRDDPRPARASSSARRRVWSQHAYIGGTDPVATVTRGAGRARLPARARDLDHRDRRRPRARRLLGRPRDHERAPGLPAPAAPAARVVRGPARDARRPVHDARGRPLPDRPRDHGPGPRARPRCASGRRGAPARARTRRRRGAPASARPGTAARARAS